MSIDDALHAPLGVEAATAAAPARRLPGKGVLAAGSVLAVLALGVALSQGGDRLAGEPFATARIDKSGTAAPPPPPTAPALAEAPAAAAPANQRQSASDAEQSSGVRVLRPQGQGAPNALVITVPDATAAPVRLAPAPDRRLVDKGRHGSLPKIGLDGQRPADVYARPLPIAHQGAKVRVAVVVTGLGLSGTGTADAISRLPGAFTLAFAPYGAELEKQVARAREGGHEVLLQVPMEPFDYPDNDPGPHTLLAGNTPEQNLDRLHWLMSRFHGYVGLTNFMGARLTASDAALAPILREAADRGLVYLDDGSSQRSLATTIAGSTGAPAARADVVLDASPRAHDMEQALGRLEALAREKGQAIGTTVALPGHVERLVRWAKAAEARGVTLVPVSALMPSPRRM